MGLHTTLAAIPRVVHYQKKAQGDIRGINQALLATKVSYRQPQAVNLYVVVWLHLLSEHGVAMLPSPPIRNIEGSPVIKRRLLNSYFYLYR